MFFFENFPSQFFYERVFLYEQPFCGNLVGFFKVKLKKEGFFCIVLTKRSSLEKSSSSGRQGCHDCSSSVWSQFLH